MRGIMGEFRHHPYDNSNEITDIPEGLFKLKNLKNLILDWNKINNLPPFLYQMKNLEIIDLDFNSIPDLSPDIKNLNKLIKGQPID